MKKKLVSLLLTLALLLTCVSAVFAAHPFQDVSPNAWYAEDVEYAYANGLLNGVSADTFAPNRPMTRSMAVTVLWRMAGAPKVEDFEHFTDVAKDSWYNRAVSWAAITGVVNGTGDMIFLPNGLITREQLVTMLYRYADLMGYATNSHITLKKYVDNQKISAYAKEAMAWAVSEGLIRGSAEGNQLMLLPKANCTRAQAAAILRRFILTTTSIIPGNSMVGISMPTKDLYRWKQDGENLKNQLEAIGCTVNLQFAANYIPLQVNQIENMIGHGCKILVIAAIDGESLCTVLEQAKDAGVTVIAYDRLIMNTDAVSYFTTFDFFAVGLKQGEYIEKELDLKHAGDKTYNIEFVGGDSGDPYAMIFYEGAMKILKPYIDAGILKCLSGQVEFDAVATPNWSTEEAQKRLENILASFYADTQLDAVLVSNDSTAVGVTNALALNYKNEVYPIITGMDCDIAAVKNMLEGKQAMSIFKDPRDLVEKTVEMVHAILLGVEPPINAMETYHNGEKIVPSYLCAPKVCDLSNYEELLLDSGYYKPWDLGL